MRIERVVSPNLRFYKSSILNTVRHLNSSVKPSRSAQFNLKIDRSLVKYFDEPLKHAHIEPQGLFLNSWIKSPEKIKIFGDHVCHQINYFHQEITNNYPDLPPKTILKLFDQISDQLCSVIDLCECLRNCHRDADFRNAADSVFESMYTMMNSFNTDKLLYDAICSIISNESRWNSLSTTEKVIAISYQKDFEKSGIELDKASRNKFVELSTSIAVLGKQFIDGTSRRYWPEVKIKKSDYPHLEQTLTRYSTDCDLHHWYVNTGSYNYINLLNTLNDPNLRNQIACTHLQSETTQVKLLEKLLIEKCQLARLVGFESFAHLQLSDKMAQTPEAVRKFLMSMRDSNIKKLSPYIESMQKKRLCEGPMYGAKLAEGDRVKYTQGWKNLEDPLTPNYPSSTGTVIACASSMFHQLYDIKFEPCEIKPGEAWADCVRKVDVICGTLGKLGSVYFDLESDDSCKSVGDAHFTIRCGRRIDDDIPGPNGFVKYYADCAYGQDGKHQLPLIAIVCGFGKDLKNLKKSNIRTLFHELGHAVHTMVGRSDYQNLSGTRCQTDFVELPSILTEKLAPLLYNSPYRKADEILLAQPETTEVTLSSLLEMNQQIYFSLIDLDLHSETSLAKLMNSTAIYQNSVNSVSPFQISDPASWHAQFAHLQGYSALYYSYLFDRVLAGRIWNKLFLDNPLSVENGMSFREEVLQWGGSRDPWKGIFKVLDEDFTTIERAMTLVGCWGEDI